jgi:predicted nuclease of predicted toxin-antitoxin system
VKFLIEENLSDKLSARLGAAYPGTKHVKQVSLSARADTEVWELARKEGFIILTQADDFAEMSMMRGAPPKVVHLAMGNHTTKEWLAIIQANAVAISHFAGDPDTGLLVLR